MTVDPDVSRPFAPTEADLKEMVEILQAARGGAADSAERQEESGRAVDRLPEHLPREGVGAAEALAAIGATLTGFARFDDPVWAAHLDTPKPWVGWAGSLWAAATGQDLAHRRSAPVARLLEKRLQSWLAPIWGMNTGLLVPDQAQANLTALWAARDSAGISRVVVSEAAHRSVSKAARVLGLSFVTLPCGDDDRLDLAALGDYARREPDQFRRSAVVLSVGTPGAGAVDPIKAARRAVAAMGTEAGWWHVDTGWCGPLALDTRSAQVFEGISRVDSVSAVLHSWMFAPVPSAFVGFRDRARMVGALRYADDEGDSQLGLSDSRGAAALAPMLVLLAYGADGVARWVRHGLDVLAEIETSLRANPEIELFAHQSLGMLLWRPRSGSVGAVFDRLNPVAGSLVTVGGRQWIRHVATGPMLDAERLLVEINRARL
ncbi:MAG: pyridoxal-dependent decarboxylase [Candidatus Nanopelagicales bacterium]|nr:pyridoxal-dependent decarboxylase [Candidatus Nanopelagicales bacterium]